MMDILPHSIFLIYAGPGSESAATVEAEAPPAAVVAVVGL
jgi:hypothetical protein